QATPGLTPSAVGALTYAGTVTFGLSGIDATSLVVTASDQLPAVTFLEGSTLTAASATLNFTASRVTSGTFTFTASNGSTFSGDFDPSLLTGLLVYTGTTSSGDNYSVSGISTAMNLSLSHFGTLDLGGFKSQLPLDGPYTDVLFSYDTTTDTASDARVGLTYTFQGASFFGPLPAAFTPSMVVLGLAAAAVKLRRKALV
ncbi:MAG TPA: hypothetical protein VHI52_07465, partial [Verrucomicrobiae bacterium]|nr:hypothetical protein [Verrucomicrobiae bacterium]